MKTLQEQAQELWDRYSQHIDDSISSLDTVAGTSIINRHDFMNACQHFMSHATEHIASQFKQEWVNYGMLYYGVWYSDFGAIEFDYGMRDLKLPENWKELCQPMFIPLTP